jgi:transposase
MRFIAERGGTFLSVLPRSRAEVRWFEDYRGGHVIDWQEVRRQRNARREGGSDSVYHGWESPQRSKEGFRVLWYKSSQKLEQDQRQRFERLAAARMEREGLGQRTGQHATADALRQAAGKILERFQVEGLLKVDIHSYVRTEHKPRGPGRPGPKTR